MGGLVLAAALLTGCSSMNPASWFESAPEPEIAVPRTPPAKADPGAATASSAPAAKAPASGLRGDRTNSRYAEGVRREVAPSKQLVRRTPAPETTQVAKADPAPAPQTAKTEPAVPPKEAVKTEALPAAEAQPQVAAAAPPRAVPSLENRQPVARDPGQVAPSSTLQAGPPPRPDVPLVVDSRPAAPKLPRLLADQFERRLSESSGTVQKVALPEPRPLPPAYAGYDPSQPFATPAPAVASYGGYGAEAPIRLVPPKSMRGARGVSVPAVPAPAGVTTQVAAVDFSGVSSRLTSADRDAIAAVARTYRQTGGMVRVVGSAPAQPVGYGMVIGGEADLALARAKAVAQELTRRGVPAHKVLVGAAANGGYGGGAQVYLDY